MASLLNSDSIEAEARDAIAIYLRKHALELRTIERHVFNWRRFAARLSSRARIYGVVAESGFGASKRLTFAFDPIGWTALERSGLKRWSGQAWIDAD